MNIIRIKTLAKKEIWRFLKVWPQTVLSPVIFGVLYFSVFGGALGDQITMTGISYLAYIIPGILLMQSTANAFQNSSSSLVIARYHGTITDILLPTLTALEKTIGFALGGLFRGILVSAAILIPGVFFAPELLAPTHPWAVFGMIVLANLLFAILGTLAGIWSKTFDAISSFTTFIITPMGFLGGVFYSIDMLPGWAQTISLYNPFLYLVEGLRWAFWGESLISPIVSFGIISLFVVGFFSFNIYVFYRGWRMKN